MWFADKLGPVPKASPQGKAHPQSAQSAAAKPVKGAAQGKNPPQAKAQARPAAAPEEPKKKKGWF